MATDGGPNIEKDGLVFGMDTGYGVANNSTATRFYRGGPTENKITNVGVSTTGWSQYGWSGGFVVTPDHDNTFELTSTNGWHNATFNHGVSTGTINVSFEYKLKSKQTTGIWGFVLNGTHLGTYTNWIGSLNSTNLPSLTEWKTFSGTYSGNGDTKLAIGLRGSDSQGLTDTMYVKNLQVENKDHQTPFVNGVRTSTQSLIDLTKSTNIDVSNVSFDSTGQPIYDGTDDYVNLGNTNVFSQFTTDFTISAYAKRLNSGGAWGNLVGDYYTNNIDGEWQLAMSNGGAFFFYRVGTGYIFNATDNFGANLWHYVVVTRVGPTISLYVNGNLINTVSNSLIFGSSSGNVNVGIDGNNSSEPFTGEIAVVKIYNRGLSIQEVQQNYNTYKNRFDT